MIHTIVNSDIAFIGHGMFMTVFNYPEERNESSCVSCLDTLS